MQLLLIEILYSTTHLCGLSSMEVISLWTFMAVKVYLLKYVWPWASIWYDPRLVANGTGMFSKCSQIVHNSVGMWVIWIPPCLNRGRRLVNRTLHMITRSTSIDSGQHSFYSIYTLVQLQWEYYNRTLYTTVIETESKLEVQFAG